MIIRLVLLYEMRLELAFITGSNLTLTPEKLVFELIQTDSLHVCDLYSIKVAYDILNQGTYYPPTPNFELKINNLFPIIFSGEFLKPADGVSTLIKPVLVIVGCF